MLQSLSLSVFAQDKANKCFFIVSPVFVHRGKKLYTTYGFGGLHGRAHWWNTRTSEGFNSYFSLVNNRKWASQIQILTKLFLVLRGCVLVLNYRLSFILIKWLHCSRVSFFFLELQPSQKILPDNVNSYQLTLKFLIGLPFSWNITRM